MADSKKRLSTWLFYFLKGVLAAGAFYWIDHLVRTHAGSDLPHFLSVFKTVALAGILGLVVVMMVANWFIETLKWKYLVGKIEKLSWYDAMSSVLAGLNLAIYTPARMGEYGGRVLYLKPENRKKGVLCVLVGNLSQLLVTCLVGLAGSLAWMIWYTGITALGAVSLGLVFSFLGLGLLYLYFNVPQAKRIWGRSRWIKKAASSLSVLESFSHRELRISFFFSLARYMIFIHQYILLLYALMGPLPYLKSASALGAIFMAQSLIPSFVLVDMGIRGAAASFFLSPLFGNQNLIPILATAFIVWFINLIVPALLGIYFVLKLKFPFGRP